MSHHSRLLLLTGIALAGCVQAAYDDAKALSVTEASSGASTSTGTGDTGIEPPTGPIQTVTGDEPPPTSTSAPAETTGEPPAEPAIVAVSLTPDPLEHPGKIAVDITAEFATGVTMQLAGAEPVPLAAGPERHFVGEIPVHTGLLNGTYEATFVPLADDVAGLPVVEEYTLALPPAGDEKLWDAPPDFGTGQIEALAVTPGGTLLAFGTIFKDKEQHCFLHRRGLDGSYKADDFSLLFPDKECMAVDMIAGEGESVHLLATIDSLNGLYWRMATMTWGETPTIVQTGKIGEVAHALARRPDGVVACGTGPSLINGLDARVWGAGMPLEFDFQPDLNGVKLKHQFDETIKDCAFAGERLVMVGEARGQHVTQGKLEAVSRSRLFVLEHAEDTEVPTWTVAGPGSGNMTQSGATALTIDAQGRSIVGLFTCGDACNPFGELRIYEPGGELAEQVPLASETLPPFDVAWSPAGYIVLASAEKLGGWSSRFLVQAYWPGKFAPAWSYGQAEQPNLHTAYALAIGPGVVVAGGVGGSGYPAIAYIHP